MTLDFTPLRNAVARLDEGLARHLSGPDDIQVRDGLIQRFEFTYDLAHKSLRRAIEFLASSPEEVDRLGFPELIRTGYEQGLVEEEWSHWKRYRELRNISSHTYDETKAKEVAAEIPGFLAGAKKLLSRLETRFAS